MQIRKLLLIGILLTCLPKEIKAAQCLPVDVSLSCSNLGNYVVSSNYIRDCGAYLPQGASCCCEQAAAPITQTQPKTVIIFSLVGVFGILTIGILIYKKNEAP